MAATESHSLQMKFRESPVLRPYRLAKNPVVLASLLFFTLLVLVRGIWVYHIAVNVPFADQWDADIGLLFLKYVKHQLQWKDFLTPANEHRIVFTRLINLLNFIGHDGQADSLVPIYLQQGICSAAGALLFYIINRKGWDLARSLTVFLFFAIPMSSENAYWAYQSQVYFLIWISVFAFWRMSQEQISLPTLFVLTIFAMLNMANAMWIPFLAAVVFIYRYFESTRRRRNLVLAFVFLLLTLLIYKLIPFNPAHKELQATSLQEFASSFIHYFNWPDGKGPFLIWLPFAISLYVFFFKKTVHSRELLFSILLYGWMLLLAAAASFGRKGDIANRYNDYLVFGLMATTVITTLLNDYRWRGLSVGKTLAWCFLVACIPDFFVHIDDSLQRGKYNMNRKIVLECALTAETQSPGQGLVVLNQFRASSYPHNERLATLLAQPEVREMLHFIEPCHPDQFEALRHSNWNF